ncbi:cell division protein FtsQ/DivIB [Texcoconibacillus texcoconensis]|uniref:Cell division protein DivIB n=1 Tax=Texcoconibacillus texcoconensis TaxID=1095777 RepID=A0A840QLE0_9BACI|nr:cell division protein FtsQ/DivIB [Texcoconibacillus texcoconensis]MBB5172170.1 cell division protein FtsQ [Texcoconibacillus texcoconensis]
MSDKKVVDLEERIPTLKEQRKQRANHRLILYLSVFFLLIASVVYFQSPLSNIQNVEVINNDYVADDWIITETHFLDASFWGYDDRSAEEQLLSHPQLAEVKFSRRFPNTIVVDVDEYNRVAYTYEDGGLSTILETGERMVIDKNGETYPTDAPLLVNFDEHDIQKEMALELTELAPELSVRMSEVHLRPTESDEKRIHVYMNDGFEVHSTVNDFSERLDAYPSIVKQLDPEVEGIIHMRMNPYFEPFTTEEDNEGERQE